MCSFPNLEQVHCSMSGSNGCFSTCIQVSQEAGKVIWYSHLFKNFPQFVVIHTIKVFSIVNKAKVDVFLESPCFFYDPMNVGNLVSGSSAFSKSSLYIEKFTYCWSLAWRILSLTLLVCEMNVTVQWFEYSLTSSFFGIGKKTDLFQSCGHYWVFQFCWHIECSPLTDHTGGGALIHDWCPRKMRKNQGHAQRGRAVWEGSCLQGKERSLRRNQTCWHLDLGLLASRTVRK